MARPSRPPGFDMTYRPADTAFGPPFRSKIPSFLYLLVALATVMVVIVAERSPQQSWLYMNVVERGVRGIIGARTLAALLVLGASASLIRTSMRGVRIRADGLEYRDVIGLGVPRWRRFRWAQIDCILLDLPDRIALDLWDGTRAHLPSVEDRAALAAALEKVGTARAIPVRGGVGLDELLEASDYGEESGA